MFLSCCRQPILDPVPAFVVQYRLHVKRQNNATGQRAGNGRAGCKLQRLAAQLPLVNANIFPDRSGGIR